MSMSDFDAILKELNDALDKQADAEIGDSSSASDPAPGVSLHDSDMTEEYMMNKNKSTKYQDTAEHSGMEGATKPTSEILEKKKMEDKEEEEQIKEASAAADALLAKIENYIENPKVPHITKSAAYVKGQKAAEAYVDILLKQADDTLQLAHRILAECVKEGKLTGDERDRIVNELAAKVDTTPEDIRQIVKNDVVSAKLIDQMFPHLQSENKSAEIVPMQPTFEKAEPVDAKEIQNMDKMEEVTGATVDKAATGNSPMRKSAAVEYEILVKKASVIDELEKASAANDGAALVMAKAKFMDLIFGDQGENQ